IPKSGQKSTKRFLRKVIQLNAVSKQPRAGDSAKSLNAFVATECLVFRRVSAPTPSSTHRALRGQRHLIFKKDRCALPNGATPNLALSFCLPTVLLSGVSQGQQSMWPLNTEAPRSKQLGDMMWVITNAKMRAAYRGHPTCSPQIVGKAG